MTRGSSRARPGIAFAGWRQADPHSGGRASAETRSGPAEVRDYEKPIPDGLGSDFLCESVLLADAYRFAAAAHAGQRQELSGPYIEHPVAVARLLHEAGFGDHVVAAGLLHDVVEHSDVDQGAVVARFGPEVGALVDAMTEPAAIESFEARKAAHRDAIASRGEEAEAIFAADKIVNASNLRAAIARLGQPAVEGRLSHPLDKKVEHYQATLELLEHVAEGLTILPRLRRELDRLADQRASDEADRIANGAADAINSLDADRLVELSDTDVEWFPALTFGDRGGAYRGHAGVRRYVADVARLWGSLRIGVRAVRRHSDEVVAICDIHAEGRISRRALTQRAAIVYWVEGGKVVRARTYVDSR